MPASSAGGPLEIVSLSASGSEEIAPKAIAPLVNCSALSTATGATIRAASASSGKKRTSWVVGSARAVETGFRFANSGLRALDRLVQRGAARGEGVAEALEDLAAVLAGRRVEGVVDVVELGLLLGLAIGRVPPAARPVLLVPRVISRYLSPNEER